MPGFALTFAGKGTGCHMNGLSPFGLQDPGQVQIRFQLLLQSEHAGQFGVLISGKPLASRKETTEAIGQWAFGFVGAAPE
jgi:hypothetical protein